MTTQNVDLAAYLYLCGLEPEGVERRNGFNVFRYRDTEYVEHAVLAYQHDATVPVRAFCEARARMKSMVPGNGNKVRGFNSAKENRRPR
jgi:hypothetical protein